MNILITGGAGFIGSRLAIRLVNEEHNVTVIDKLDGYYSKLRKQQQLDEVKKTGSFHFYPYDLLNEEECRKIFQASSFDCVVHLAGLPGVTNSIENPHIYIDEDIKATVNVLRLCGEAKVNHVVFASSSSVYGEQQGYPLSEELASGKVVSPYSAAKFGAESFCHVYQQIYGFQLAILRLFTVYGPSARPDMAIPIFIKRLLEDESIDVFGKNTARDYTYIDDIVDGIRSVIDQPRPNEIYNLGSGNPISMRQLLALLKDSFPKMRINQKATRTGDVTSTWANITKARNELGFQPQVSIQEGLRRTIKWARTNA